MWHPVPDEFALKPCDRRTVFQFKESKYLAG